MKIKHKIWRRQKLDKILKKWYNYIVKIKMRIEELKIGDKIYGYS